MKDPVGMYRRPGDFKRVSVDELAAFEKEVIAPYGVVKETPAVSLDLVERLLRAYGHAQYVWTVAISRFEGTVTEMEALALLDKQSTRLSAKARRYGKLIERACVTSNSIGAFFGLSRANHLKRVASYQIPSKLNAALDEVLAATSAQLAHLSNERAKQFLIELIKSKDVTRHLVPGRYSFAESYAYTPYAEAQRLETKVRELEASVRGLTLAVEGKVTLEQARDRFEALFVASRKERHTIDGSVSDTYVDEAVDFCWRGYTRALRDFGLLEKASA